MMGNGIALDRKFGTKLRKIKPRLNALSQLGLTETGAEGVDVLFSAEIAGFIKATSKSSCKGLINNSIGWSLTLGTLGISHRLTARYDNSRLTAVSDQTLRAFSDEDIKKMLSGKLLCDAMSAAILFERGFGEYCGFSQCEWRSQELDGYAYETIESENLNVYPHTYPRMSTQRCGQRLLKMTPLKNAEIKSTIRHYERSFLYPGMIRYKNNLGGEVILIAYELCKDQFFMSFFNEFRRIFLQHTIKEVAPELPIAFGLKHPLHVYRNRMPDGSTLLSIVNPTHDELSEVTFEINYANLTKTSMLQPDGVWRNMNIASQMVVYKLSPLEAIYIKIQQLKDEYK
jgi:hypothetical protein